MVKAVNYLPSYGRESPAHARKNCYDGRGMPCPAVRGARQAPFGACGEAHTCRPRRGRDPPPTARPRPAAGSEPPDRPPVELRSAALRSASASGCIVFLRLVYGAPARLLAGGASLSKHRDSCRGCVPCKLNRNSRLFAFSATTMGSPIAHRYVSLVPPVCRPFGRPHGRPGNPA